jgi:hypothetical protein
MAAIYRAYRDYYRWRRKYVKKDHLPEMKLLKMKGVFHGIMIWRYYFLKHKHFSELI